MYDQTPLIDHAPTTDRPATDGRSSIALTLDGSVDAPRKESMRWMPPEQAARIRAQRSTERPRRTIGLRPHVQAALADADRR